MILRFFSATSPGASEEKPSHDQIERKLQEIIDFSEKYNGPVQSVQVVEYKRDDQHISATVAVVFKGT